MNPGIALSIGTYVCWGMLPLYFQLIAQATPVEIVCHRILWSLVALLAYRFLAARSGAVPGRIDARILLRYAMAAALISLNWGAYVWGVHSGQVLVVSLGYFILPMVNVVLGTVLLGERLSRLQAVGVAIAAGGVVYLCLRSDSIPWIAFVVAISFSLYSVVKKQTPLPAAQGLALETLILAPVALGLLLWLQARGELVFLHHGATLDLLLIGAGVVTVVPLLLFAAAIRHISLTLIGMLQYISPTLQFLTGFLLLGEPLTHARTVGFALIWMGLAVYLYETAWRSRRAAAPRRRPA